MVEGVPGVDDVGGVTLVAVGEEAGLAHLDVVEVLISDVGAEPFQHGGGDVDGDHSWAVWGDSQCELPGAGSEIDDH